MSIIQIDVLVYLFDTKQEIWVIKEVKVEQTFVAYKDAMGTLLSSSVRLLSPRDVPQSLQHLIVFGDLDSRKGRHPKNAFGLYTPMIFLGVERVEEDDVQASLTPTDIMLIKQEITNRSTTK